MFFEFQNNGFSVLESLNNGFSVLEFSNNGFSVVEYFSVLERFSFFGTFQSFQSFQCFRPGLIAALLNTILCITSRGLFGTALSQNTAFAHVICIKSVCGQHGLA